MWSWLQEKVFTQFLTSALRHLITAAGALLTSAGLAANDVQDWMSATQKLVAGIAAILVGFAWSYAEKKFGWLGK